MSGFKALKRGQKRKVVLHTQGPRTDAEAEAFRKDLLRLLKKHKTRVLGYRTGRKKSKAKRRSTRRRTRRS